MPRPRYSANKRAREIRKQEERARKLARKHGRSAQRASRPLTSVEPMEPLTGPVPQPEDPGRTATPAPEGAGPRHDGAGRAE